MEVKATLQDYEGNDIDLNVAPKKVRKKYNSVPRDYDGSSPLPDVKIEDYANKIIQYLGDRKRAYAEAFYPNMVDPYYPPMAPYKHFERKAFQKRYNYLMNNAMGSIGIDKKSLLLKTAELIEYSVKNKKVKDFTSLVDTIVKLEGYANLGRKGGSRTASATLEDLAPVKALLEGLNG